MTKYVDFLDDMEAAAMMMRDWKKEKKKILNNNFLTPEQKDQLIAKEAENSAGWVMWVYSQAIRCFRHGY